MFTSIPAGYMNQYTLVHRHQCISLVTLGYRCCTICILHSRHDILADQENIAHHNYIYILYIYIYIHYQILYRYIDI